MALERLTKWRWSGRASVCTAVLSITLLIYVFAHPRCFTAAGTDHLPYWLFAGWCLAELLALLGAVAGLVSVPMSRGKSLSAWIGLGMNVLTFLAGVVYPIVFFASSIGEELSKPGFHGLGK